MEWQTKANWKDRSWRYVNAASTDITKTIARVKREMKEMLEKEKQQKVHTIKKISNLR